MLIAMLSAPAESNFSETVWNLGSLTWHESCRYSFIYVPELLEQFIVSDPVKLLGGRNGTSDLPRVIRKISLCTLFFPGHGFYSVRGPRGVPYSLSSILNP